MQVRSEAARLALDQTYDDEDDDEEEDHDVLKQQQQLNRNISSTSPPSVADGLSTEPSPELQRSSADRVVYGNVEEGHLNDKHLVESSNKEIGEDLDDDDKVFDYHDNDANGNANQDLDHLGDEVDDDAEHDDAEGEYDDEDDADKLVVHGERIHVAVRKRPVSDGQTDVLRCGESDLVLLEPRKKVDLTQYTHQHAFAYDSCFSERDSTVDLWQRSVYSLVYNLFQGGTSTCFCFGQTASGKTHTLFGQCGGGESKGIQGLYQIAAQKIFDTVQELSDTAGLVMAVGVSMFEIYGQKVFDLLDDHKALTALEDKDGVLQLVGLSRHRCEDFEHFVEVTDGGRKARSTTATGANATSSRSHCVMAISLLDDSGADEAISYTPKNSDDVLGKLSLIDLAGSERGVDNEATDKTTRMEGKQINTSLLALKEVIRALDSSNKKSHAPFRQSRLTQVLQESLMGDMCQTVVVACVSATQENCQQTINTLRYAEGLKRSQKSKTKKTIKEGAQKALPPSQSSAAAGGTTTAAKDYGDKDKARSVHPPAPKRSTPAGGANARSPARSTASSSISSGYGSNYNNNYGVTPTRTRAQLSSSSGVSSRSQSPAGAPKTPKRRSTVTDVSTASNQNNNSSRSSNNSIKGRNSSGSSAGPPSAAAVEAALDAESDEENNAEVLRASLAQRSRTPPKKGVSFNSPRRLRSNSETDLMDHHLHHQHHNYSGHTHNNNSSSGANAAASRPQSSLKQLSPVVAKTAARRRTQESEMEVLRADVEEALRYRQKTSPGGTTTTIEDDLQFLGDEDARDSFEESFLGADSDDDDDDEEDDDVEEEEEERQGDPTKEGEFLHGERIHVIVRKRPVNHGQTDVLQCSGSSIFLHEPKKKVDLTQYTHSHKFKYDNSYSEIDNTGVLYRRSVHSLVHNLFQGGTSTCFCFGQTASGKTHTLFGQCGGGESKGIQGLYQIAAQRIFDSIEQNPGGFLPADFRVKVGVSMFEIYGQKVFDLLDDHKALTALEDKDGVLQLVGLSRHRCEDFEHFLSITDYGREARSTTATGANATSSRSHCVMAISLLDESDGPGEAVSYTPQNKEDVVGKLSLIDLAGSERGKDNEATDKTTRMEGKQINTSLLALKEVIRALDSSNNKRHAPFRQSRLTQVLQESLMGDMCQTVVVACVSATLENCQQTLNTLRYAEGLKKSQGSSKGKVREIMNYSLTVEFRCTFDLTQDSRYFPVCALMASMKHIHLLHTCCAVQFACDSFSSFSNIFMYHDRSACNEQEVAVVRQGARTPVRGSGSNGSGNGGADSSQARDTPQTAANMRWKLAVRAVSLPPPPSSSSSSSGQRHIRAHSSPARDRRGGGGTGSGGGHTPGRLPSREKRTMI